VDSVKSHDSDRYQRASIGWTSGDFQDYSSLMDGNTAIAVFGGGCFWCTEAVFEQLQGVISVKPGYAGGTTPDPTYEEVCTGETGHAEVIEVR
jgi:Peptide methionine sulfoxide reductase